ncbi:hypothetical protein GMMP15_1310003 [Candidatus Magnetomoraceae bacterium gMMP-15]
MSIFIEYASRIYAASISTIGTIIYKKIVVTKNETQVKYIGVFNFPP